MLISSGSAIIRLIVFSNSSIIEDSNEIKGTMDKRKILVVEDDLKSLRIIKEYLSDHYEVIETEDADEALGELKTLEQSEDDSIKAIVLDWMLPGMSGLELLKLLKTNSKYRNIPVIMQTARTATEDIISGLRYGVYQYLTKPYDEQVLLAMVDSAVEEYDRFNEEKLAIQSYQKSTKHFFKKQLTDLKVLEALNEFSLGSYSPDCKTPIDLVQLVVKALKKFQFPSASAKEAALAGEKEVLRCSIMVRSDDENEIGYSDRGYEEKLCLADRYLLSESIDTGTILTKKNYTAIPSSSGRVAFLVRNSPTDEMEQEKAVKIISNIIEYFEKRLQHFEDQLKIKEQMEELKRSHEQTKEVIQSSLHQFEGVNEKYQQVKERQMQIWEQLIEKLGPDSPLVTEVSNAMNEALMLYGEDHLTDQQFLEIMKELGEIFGHKQQVSEEAFAEQLGGASQADVDALLASLSG